jgi:SH3-like domain-containing protein
MAVLARWALAGAMVLAAAGQVPAQEGTRPQPRPVALASAFQTPEANPEAAPEEAPETDGETDAETDAAADPAPALAAPAPAPVVAAQPRITRDPTRGSVTNLPLPRFVSLKGNAGNARRGPGLTHRIDWVFTRSGMPLKITAEYEHWRRVEDAEGFGGWVNYALLSGVRSALVAVDVAEFRDRPQDEAEVIFKAERNVVGWIKECHPDWCKIEVDGHDGWIRKAALWGVLPGEMVE